MTTRHPAIVILVPGFPENEAETNCLPPLQNFVETLTARNPAVAVHVVSFQYPFKAQTYTWHGAAVYAIGGKNTPFPSRIWTWLKASYRVLQLARSHQILALHSMWLAECTYVASCIAPIIRTRHIATIRGQDALAGNPYLKHLRFDRMTITAGSERAAEVFQKHSGRKVDHVIPTGLDAPALPDHDRHMDRTIDILGVGSLSPLKDFQAFLEIVTQVHSEHPTLKCRIIGDGPQRESLDAYIKDHGLQEVVQLAGRLPREDVLRAMQQSKILLHTSRYEGQGYVLLEALGAGMRVVCRDVGYSGPGPGAYRCTTTNEMTVVIKRLLQSGIAETYVEIPGIEQTAAAFEKIYGVNERNEPPT